MTKLALIRKTKPTWQKGFLNGIGGKIEADEEPIDAMCREFQEETGHKTFYYDWQYLTKLTHVDNEWEVDFYWSHAIVDLDASLTTTTEEEIVVINMDDLDYENVIPNLKWLVKICLDPKIVAANFLYR